MTKQRARLTTLAVAAVLAACSGPTYSANPLGSQAGPQQIRFRGRVVRFGDTNRVPHAGSGWIAKPDATASLLYGSSYDGGFINIYKESGKNQSPIGKLTSTLVSPQGMTVDAKHNLWVANTNAFNVVAFQRGVTTPLRTLNDPNYYPISVAVNSHGTVYAANAESTTGPPGNVTVWKAGSTNPTATLTYPNFSIVLGVGVDHANNVYVSYVPTSGPPAMVVFPAGSKTGQLLNIQNASLGDMSFDASEDLLMETQSNSLGIWAPPYTSGPTRTLGGVFGNEPTLDKKQVKVWIAYANFSTPKIEGYNFTTGTLVDTITNGWTNTAIPYGVALDPAVR